MRFVYRLTVPANTLLIAPASKKVDLVTGQLTRIEIEFRPGCAWMVRTIIKEGLYQIAPATPDEEFIADGETMSFSAHYPLNDRTPQLELIGWSPGTIYEHVLTYRFDVEPAGGDEKNALLNLLSQALVSPGEEF
jgi:hypothetical protein